ncbi:MAG: tetratricopeptide repeat protein [Pseudomonadales bacterium]
MITDFPVPRLRLLAIATVVMLTACVPQVTYTYNQSDEANYLARVVGEQGDAAVELLTLSPELKEFLDKEIDQSWRTRKRLTRLRELLFSEDELNIKYDAQNTLTASETYSAGVGNCLSMTALFISAARYVGLDANYQKVEVDPTWDHEGNTMIRYEHIVATGKIASGAVYVVDFLPDFIVGDMRSYVISDNEAQALYFNNLGAEGIVDGNIDSAIENIRFAIQLLPAFSDAWNNMGAAMRRAGDYDLAEFSYHRALRQDINNYSALSNLAMLYEHTNRSEQAEQFAGRVESYRASNPYFHYAQAKQAFERGSYRKAENHLKKSIRLKRDDPDFYVALSQTHGRMGEQRKSRDLLALAEKYRTGELRAPQRNMNHRYWTMSLEVNPGL